MTRLKVYNGRGAPNVWGDMPMPRILNLETSKWIALNKLAQFREEDVEIIYNNDIPFERIERYIQEIKGRLGNAIQ